MDTQTFQVERWAVSNKIRSASFGGKLEWLTASLNSKDLMKTIINVLCFNVNLVSKFGLSIRQ